MPAHLPLAQLLTISRTGIPALSRRDKLRLAASPRTSPAALEVLLRDQDVDVRIELAGRRQASEALLRELTQDSALPVRECLAYRATLPRDIQALLLADPSRLVRTAVLLSHPLKAGSANPESASVLERRLAAATPGLTLEQARQLACDPDWPVRRLILEQVQSPEWLEVVALVALAPELSSDSVSSLMVQGLLLKFVGELHPGEVSTSAISALMRNRCAIWKALGRHLAHRRHAALTGDVEPGSRRVDAPMAPDGIENRSRATG